ncbi:hypothetical protein CT061_24240 [Salmonella enterica subsp. enterica serovar Agona]|nr:hypothetical protein [Salmonella enterica subsp. enterica serovar Agona]ELX8032522.1 hypothetical protein [Salmonella enterica subsp. enterica serovar Agona]
MARLSVTVDDDLKRDFLAAAREYGLSGAALVRAFMQAVVDGGRDLDGLRDQVRADLEHPAPARTPAAALQLVRRITLDMLTTPASQ